MEYFPREYEIIIDNPIPKLKTILKVSICFEQYLSIKYFIHDSYPFTN